MPVTVISTLYPAETVKTSSLGPLRKEILTTGERLELQSDYIQNYGN